MGARSRHTGGQVTGEGSFGGAAVFAGTLAANLLPGFTLPAGGQTFEVTRQLTTTGAFQAPPVCPAGTVCSVVHQPASTLLTATP